MTNRSSYIARFADFGLLFWALFQMLDELLGVVFCCQSPELADRFSAELVKVWTLCVPALL